MNDIEKLSQKNGITFQSVKEVLDSLLADDLVTSDKIGAGNFYWSFPSKTYQIVPMLLYLVGQKDRIIEG